VTKIKKIFDAIKRIAIKSRFLIDTIEDRRFKSSNIHGDKQTRYDILINRLIIAELNKVPDIGCIYSEELKSPLVSTGVYTIFIDPVDGSKNSLVNSPFGSLFGIYKHNKIIAAAYILHGPKTLIVTAKNIVREYTVKDNQVKFITNIRMPIGNNLWVGGYFNYYLSNEQRFFKQHLHKRPYILYDSAFVHNLHKILKQGGLFLYPKTKLYPNGKLRLLFEAKTAAYITENAGGLATDGKRRIIGKPGGFMDQTPLILGNKEMVKRFYKPS